MKKHEMALVIFATLFNTTPEAAKHAADNNHGEFTKIMKGKKDHITSMYNLALRVKSGQK